MDQCRVSSDVSAQHPAGDRRHSWDDQTLAGYGRLQAESVAAGSAIYCCVRGSSLPDPDVVRSDHSRHCWTSVGTSLRLSEYKFPNAAGRSRFHSQ